MKITDTLSQTEYKGIQRDATGGYLISQEGRLTLKALFSGWEKNTTEIQLQNLGEFPLPDQAAKWLNEKIILQDKSETLEIPVFLRKSNIPIFFSKSFSYIPAEAQAICRFFHDMWMTENLEEDLERQVFLGYLVITSFAS